MLEHLEADDLALHIKAYHNIYVTSETLICIGLDGVAYGLTTLRGGIDGDGVFALERDGVSLFVRVVVKGRDDLFDCLDLSFRLGLCDGIFCRHIDQG